MKKLIHIISFLFCLGLNAQTITTLDTLKACHDCWGFGRFADGFRGEPVYKVTNLNNSGTGSRRQALADASSNGGGYIIYEIAGTITQTSATSIPANVYDAGQTAFRNSGQGITLRQNATYDGALISGIGSNSMLRYLRGRRGTGVTDELNGDVILITSGTNIMLDHLSLSWGTDETFNIWGAVTDVTMQYTIISESLSNATHSEGEHSKGALVGNGSNRMSFYKNYFAHNVDRNPLIGGGPPPNVNFEIVNNAIYNSKYFGMNFERPAGGFRVNIIKNRFKRGGDTSSGRYQLTANDDTDNLFYLNGNISDVHRPNESYDDWDAMGCVSCGTYMSSPLPDTYQSLSLFDYPLNYTESYLATELQDSLLPLVGASLYEDAVDVRVKEDMVDGTGGIIDDPSDVGGWPTIANMSSVPTDTDDDGMPDAFETEHSITDANGTKEVWYFFTDDHYLDNQAGYTNIEIYLMSLTGELMQGAVPYDDDSDGNVEYELDTTQKAASKNAIQNKLIKI